MQGWNDVAVSPSLSDFSHGVGGGWGGVGGLAHLWDSQQFVALGTPWNNRPTVCAGLLHIQHWLACVRVCARVHVRFFNIGLCVIWCSWQLLCGVSAS